MCYCFSASPILTWRELRHGDKRSTFAPKVMKSDGNDDGKNTTRRQKMAEKDCSISIGSLQ